MQGLKDRLGTAQPMLGGVDVGSSGYWWDYGTLGDYRDNNLKLLAENAEGEAMRRFFEVTDKQQGSDVASVDVDDSSVLLNCNIQGGRVRNSLLVGVTATEIDVENCVLVQVAAPQIGGRGILLYDVIDKRGLCLDPETVLAGVFLKDGQARVIRTDFSRDGRSDWSQEHSGNGIDYDGLHTANADCDPREILALKRAAFAELAATLSVRDSGNS